jgi:hypothetical protein
MPETSTISDDTPVKSRATATIELTPLRTSTTLSVGATTPVGSPAIVGTPTTVHDAVPGEFPTGTRLYAIFLALALAVLIVGLVCIISLRTILHSADE